MELTFRAFLRALSANTLTLMSGAASVPFAALSAFAPTDWQRVIFGVLAVFSVLFATYLVWRVEVERANTAEEKSAQAEKQLAEYAPDLEMNFLNVIFGGQWPARPGIATAMLIVMIANRGRMGTAVKQWGAAVRLGDKVMPGQITQLLQPLTMSFEARKGVDALKFNPQDAIFVKANNPIAAGGLIEGSLFIVFEELKPSDLVSPFFIITFKDVLGREYTATTTQGDAGELAYTPELHAAYLSGASTESS